MPPEVIDSLDKDSLKPLVEKLLAQIDQLLEQNKSLLARIAKLEGGDGKPPKTPANSGSPLFHVGSLRSNLPATR